MVAEEESTATMAIAAPALEEVDGAAEEEGVAAGVVRVKVAHNPTHDIPKAPAERGAATPRGGPLRQACKPHLWPRRVRPTTVPPRRV